MYKRIISVFLCLNLSTASSLPAMPYLKGLTQADVTLNLKNFEWGKWYGKSLASKCGKFSVPNGGFASVCMYGETERIGRVAINVGVSRDLADQLLPYMATLPFTGSRIIEAKSWIAANIAKSKQGKILQKTIGGATYQLYGDANSAVFMEVKHPNFEAWINQLP